MLILPLARSAVAPANAQAEKADCWLLAHFIRLAGLTKIACIGASRQASAACTASSAYVTIKVDCAGLLHEYARSTYGCPLRERAAVLVVSISSTSAC